MIFYFSRPRQSLADRHRENVIQEWAGPFFKTKTLNEPVDYNDDFINGTDVT